MAILPEISGPDDVKRLDAKQLDELAAELRQTIIDTVSRQGGHLASNLGDVELTIALHRAFNSPTDKLVFDVGHQIYAHKLLTGRQEQFKTLRSYHGMSGFPCREESEHDLFDTGHSSTSISMALGLARARDLNHEDYHVVAIVGDGALTGGMCYEAMNDAGNGHTRLIVVLNDNEMSISKNVGALSEYFKHLRASASWYGSKKRIRDKLTRVPLIGKPLARAIENAKNMVKSVTTGGEMFEALGFRYLGPFDGHNIEEMTHVFEEAKQVQDTPLLIHVITKKGYGYDLAERQPEKFHGVAPFRVENGMKRSIMAWLAAGALLRARHLLCTGGETAVLDRLADRAAELYQPHKDHITQDARLRSLGGQIQKMRAAEESMPARTAGQQAELADGWLHTAAAAMAADVSCMLEMSGRESTQAEEEEVRMGFC